MRPSPRGPRHDADNGGVAVQPQHGDADLLTSEQAAQHLGLAPAALRELTREGALQSYRTPTGRRRYRLRDVEAYRAAQPARPQG